MDDAPLRRSLFWLTTVRVVVLFLILLSAILVQAGSGPSVPVPGAAPENVDISYL